MAPELPLNDPKPDAHWNAALAARIRQLADDFGSVYAFSKRCGIATSLVHHWLKERGDPTRRNLVKIVEGCRVRWAWLMTGEGARYREAGDPETLWEETTDHVVWIPYWNVKMQQALNKTTGSSPQEEISRMRNSFPCPRKLIARINIEVSKLIAVKISGDTMSPTLFQGDTLLVDTSNKRPSDGVFAFFIETEVMVKRITSVSGDEIEIGLDNKSYGSIRCTVSDFKNRNDVLGRAVWSERTL